MPLHTAVSHSSVNLAVLQAGAGGRCQHQGQRGGAGHASARVPLILVPFQSTSRGSGLVLSHEPTSLFQALQLVTFSGSAKVPFFTPLKLCSTGTDVGGGGSILHRGCGKKQ